jgi:hypothetical protein
MRDLRLWRWWRRHCCCSELRRRVDLQVNTNVLEKRTVSILSPADQWQDDCRTMNWKGYGTQRTKGNLSFHPGSYLERLSRIIKCEDCRSQGRNLNPRLPNTEKEYKPLYSDVECLQGIYTNCKKNRMITNRAVCRVVTLQVVTDVATNVPRRRNVYLNVW